MKYLSVVAALLIYCSAGNNNGVAPAVNVENSEPVIQSITLIPEAVRLGESCLVRCEASDADNDQLEYEWEPLVGGSIAGSGSEVFYTSAGCCSEPYIQVTVKDSKGATISEQFKVPLRVD